MDTNERSSEPPQPATNAREPKPWALWAALAMLAAGILAFVYVLSAATSNPERSPGLSRFAVGEMQRLQVLETPPPMPTHALVDAEGRPTSLADLADGRVTVVNYWATWCAPCETEMPTLAALHRRYGERVLVAPVSADRPDRAQAAREKLARLSGGGLAFVMFADPNALFELGAPGLPLTVIYDRSGAEAARVVGDADWDSAEARALIDAVLAEGET